MKKLFALFAVFLLAVPAFCEPDNWLWNNLFEEGPVFSLTPQRESIILGAGATVYTTDLILRGVCKKNNTEISRAPFDKNGVNTFDRALMQPYSHLLDNLADFSVALSMATPLVCLTAGTTEHFTVSLMYGETLLWAQGTKELLKFLVSRNRPYMYYENFPGDSIENGDYAESFPSGHSTIAWASAVFTSYVFSSYFPDSHWKLPVIIGSLSVATATSVLRVASGNHFPTDVISGALLGGFTGFLIPFLHKNSIYTKKGKRVDFVPVCLGSSTGLGVNLSF